VSEPIQTQFGWHVILLNEERSQDIPTLEDVREELVNGLRNARIEARIGELVTAAEIDRPALDIDPSIITNADLLTE